MARGQGRLQVWDQMGWWCTQGIWQKLALLPPVASLHGGTDQKPEDKAGSVTWPLRASLLGLVGVGVKEVSLQGE